MQGRSPEVLDELIAVRVVNHSTIAIQELMHAVGVLDPGDPRTRGVIGEIDRLIEAMPTHRVFAPDPDVLGKAALLSGMVCRLQGHGADRKLRALHDCVLFLQAQKLGFTILTANIADFDILLQLVPAGRALGFNLSGCSGGPVLMHGMRNGLHRWFPVGLIIRGPRDVGKGEIASFDIIRARRIHCVKPDGTLEKPSAGGWLP